MVEQSLRAFERNSCNVPQSNYLVSPFRWIPVKYREAQTNFFGKRGITWHITVVSRKKKPSATAVDVMDEFEEESGMTTSNRQQNRIDEEEGEEEEKEDEEEDEEDEDKRGSHRTSKLTDSTTRSLTNRVERDRSISDYSQKRAKGELVSQISLVSLQSSAMQTSARVRCC